MIPPRLAFGFALGAAVIAFAPASFAQNIASFVVANEDGYGVDNCLESGDSCGRVVATSWCVANGYARSIAIRRAEPGDITGSISQPTQVAAAGDTRAVVITCEK